MEFNFDFISVDLLVLVCASLIFLILVYLWHTSHDVEFDVKTLLVDGETKRFSLYKFGQFVALCVSTWILIYETRNNRLSEWLFTFYMVAWSGVNLANKYVDKISNKDNK